MKWKENKVRKEIAAKISQTLRTSSLCCGVCKWIVLAHGKYSRSISLNMRMEICMFVANTCLYYVLCGHGVWACHAMPYNNNNKNGNNRWKTQNHNNSTERGREKAHKIVLHSTLIDSYSNRSLPNNTAQKIKERKEWITNLQHTSHHHHPIYVASMSITFNGVLYCNSNEIFMYSMQVRR